MKRFLLFLTGSVFFANSFSQSFDGFIHFDGAGDYADNQAAFEVLPDNSDFTLELRFRTCATFPTSFNLFDYRQSTAGSGIDAFYSDFLGAVQIIIQGDGGFQDIVYINAPLPLNTLNNGEWKHLAITYNNTSEIASIYIDGDLAAQEDSVSFAPGSGSFVLGAADLGYIWPFPGEMDEFRTSNLIRYAADFTPSSAPFSPDTNTLALWHFDESEGTNVFTDEVNDYTFIGSETTSTIQVIDNNTIEICPGTEVVLNGHDGFETYLWSPSNGLNSASISDPSTTPANSTSYTLEASNGICNYADVVQIAIGDLNATANGNFSICEGDSTQITVCCGFIYNWSPATSISDNTSNQPFLYPTETTTYIVDVFESINCADQDTITIVVNPSPIADIIASTDTICLNDIGQPTISAVDMSATSYQWFPFEAVGCPNCQSSSVLITSTSTITLVVSNEFGCIASDEQLITVLDCVGVEDDLVEKTWSVYPNPFNDVLNFAGLTRDDTIELRDATGRLLLTSVGPVPMQTRELPCGTYFIRVQSNGIVTHKMIQKI
jgi:hypothetical protein